MTKEIQNTKRVCGNCRYHNAYNYPDKIFCFSRFNKQENPVISVFDSCDEWENKLQDCYCLEDTLSKRRTKTKPKKSRR